MWGSDYTTMYGCITENEIAIGFTWTDNNEIPQKIKITFVR